MAATVHVLPTMSVITFRHAATEILDRRDLAPTTVRAYAATYTKIADVEGDTPLMALDAAQLAGMLQARWGSAAAATYNRHRAASSSLFEWAVGQGWIVDNPVRGVERRRERRTRTQEALRGPRVLVELYPSSVTFKRPGRARV